MDTIYKAEKKQLINDARTWLEIRELRNRIAHEYATSDLKKIFDQVIEQTPAVLELKQKIK